MRDAKKKVHQAPSEPREYQTFESWQREKAAEAAGLTTEEFLEQEMERSMEESMQESFDEPKMNHESFVRWVEASLKAIRDAQARKKAGNSEN